MVDIVMSDGERENPLNMIRENKSFLQTIFSFSLFYFYQLEIIKRLKIIIPIIYLLEFHLNSTREPNKKISIPMC